MRIDKAHENGYMTVEASFIVPWVLFILVWLIYLGYFEYDRCLAFQDDYALATQVASQIMSVDEQQNWLYGHITASIKNKYMGTHNVAFDGEVNASKVKVFSSLSVRHPLSFHADMIPRENWSITDTVYADNYSFVKRIRLFRSVGRVVDSMK